MAHFRHGKNAGRKETQPVSVLVSACKRSGKLVPGQPLVGVTVFGPRLCDDLGGQLRPGGLLVPSDFLEIIADELLVKGWLRLADFVGIQWPEARRIRRERFVNPEKFIAG